MFLMFEQFGVDRCSRTTNTVLYGQRGERAGSLVSSNCRVDHTSSWVLSAVEPAPNQRQWLHGIAPHYGLYRHFRLSTSPLWSEPARTGAAKRICVLSTRESLVNWFSSLLIWSTLHLEFSKKVFHWSQAVPHMTTSLIIGLCNVGLQCWDQQCWSALGSNSFWKFSDPAEHGRSIEISLMECFH